MRTDSTRVSAEAITEVREYITSEYGAPYLPGSPNTYKEKKEAQAAHEAIRPTSAMRHPDQVKQYLQEDEFKVYKLIWQRFVASQMNPAVFDQTSVDIDAKSGGDVFWFRVTGSVMKFDGFLKCYEESKDSKDEDCLLYTSLVSLGKQFAEIGKVEALDHGWCPLDDTMLPKKLRGTQDCS